MTFAVFALHELLFLKVEGLKGTEKGSESRKRKEP